jgi:hypothetical protein
VADIPLPRWAYVPGPGQVPDIETLEAAKRHVPVRYEGCVPDGDVAWRYGLALNDAGFFWECHEILEAVWKVAPKGGRDRILLRALIQIANANLKLKLNRPNAVRRLLQEAQSELVELDRRYPSDAAGGFTHHFDRPPLHAVIAEHLQQTDETLGRFASGHAKKYILFAL